MIRVGRLLALIALGLGTRCSRSTDRRALPPIESMAAAQPVDPLLPPTLPPPSVPSLGGRPPDRPCKIVYKRKDAKREVVTASYRLHYGQDGRLESATRQLALACPFPNERCDGLLGPESLSTRYEYSDQGRLSAVVAFCNEGIHPARLTISYAATGKVDHYAWVEPPNEGHQPQHVETKVAYDTAGRPVALVSRTEPLSTKTRPIEGLMHLEGGKESFSGAPIVWPGDTERLYFGETRSVDVGTIEGTRSCMSGGMAWTVDPDGKTRRGVNELNGKTVTIREFEYECPEKRAVPDNPVAKGY